MRAKYFTKRPDNTQWQQAGDSVKKALEKHPKPTKYIFCMPINRADPMITSEKTVCNSGAPGLKSETCKLNSTIGVAAS